MPGLETNMEVFSVELEFKVMELGTITIKKKESPGARTSTQQHKELFLGNYVGRGATGNRGHQRNSAFQMQQG